MARGARRSRAPRPDGSRVTKGTASPVCRSRSRAEQGAARRRRRVELGDRHAGNLAQEVGQPREARGAVSQEKRGRRARARAEAHLLDERAIEVAGGGDEGRARQLDRVISPARAERGGKRLSQAQLAQPARERVVEGLLAGAGVPGIEARLAHELGRDGPRPERLRRPSIPGPPRKRRRSASLRPLASSR